MAFAFVPDAVAMSADGLIGSVGDYSGCIRVVRRRRRWRWRSIEHQPLAECCRDGGIERQAMILVSPALGARQRPELTPSKLYDAAFPRRFQGV